MRDLMQAFMDVSKDLKQLIEQIKELNVHLTKFEEITENFKDLTTELKTTNETIANFLGLFKEMSSRD